jgi:hypothetical protein
LRADTSSTKSFGGFLVFGFGFAIAFSSICGFVVASISVIAIALSWSGLYPDL